MLIISKQLQYIAASEHWHQAASQNRPTASNGVLTMQQTERFGDVAKALLSLNSSAVPHENLVLAAFTTLVSLHVGCKAEKAAFHYCV
jgi:hypothetical protein